MLFVDWLIQSLSQISLTGTAWTGLAVPVSPATAQRLLKADHAVLPSADRLSKW